jgi:hypothetical protein
MVKKIRRFKDYSLNRNQNKLNQDLHVILKNGKGLKCKTARLALSSIQKQGLDHNYPKYKV